MSSLNQLRNNRNKYLHKRNNARSRRNNHTTTINNKKKYSTHFKHYNKLVRDYGRIITQKELAEFEQLKKDANNAEFEQLKKDANNAVEEINEPNNVSPELKYQLKQFSIHRKAVNNVSKILEGNRKGTRKRRKRKFHTTRNNRNPLMANENCDEKRGCCGKACNRIKGLFQGGKRRRKQRKKSRRNHKKKQKKRTRKKHKKL